MFLRWIIAVVLMLGLVAADSPPEEEADVPTGPILVGGVSVPVLQGERVRLFEYGVVALHIDDNASHMSVVCEKQYDIVDALLTYLHTHPFPNNSESDGPAAQREMLAMIKEIVGGGIVNGIDVLWTINPLHADPVAYGDPESIACGDEPVDVGGNEQ